MRSRAVVAHPLAVTHGVVLITHRAGHQF
jgi:hypothetical protein